jgi:hypothetical protein
MRSLCFDRLNQYGLAEITSEQSVWVRVVREGGFEIVGFVAKVYSRLPVELRTHTQQEGGGEAGPVAYTVRR